MNNYSLGSGSRRWWWPSAAAGAACSLAISALFAASASSSAALTRDPGVGSGVGSGVGFADRTCPPPPDVRFVGGPWVPAVPTGCDTLDRWWLHVDQQLCAFDPRYLPRTPDAVEGWYRGCLDRRAS